MCANGQVSALKRMLGMLWFDCCQPLPQLLVSVRLDARCRGQNKLFDLCGMHTRAVKVRNTEFARHAWQEWKLELSAVLFGVGPKLGLPVYFLSLYLLFSNMVQKKQ